MKNIFFTIIFLLIKINLCYADKILIPMDNLQTNHLRAYGVAYSCLKDFGLKVEWLLNYRGGSFLTENILDVVRKAKDLGVSYEIINDDEVQKIYKTIELNNMEKILLERAPRIAVYAPHHIEPWDDAVVLALTYAKIPFTIIWDDQILQGDLQHFDWLHLHHEDFTGQYGKFYPGFRFTKWYQDQVRINEYTARKFGFRKVQHLKLAVAKKIREFVEGGKLLFAMCSSPDSIDIALSADGVDIVPAEIDGDGIDFSAQQRLNFNETFAFTNFILETNIFIRELSNINVVVEPAEVRDDYFTLFEFSAKHDPVPTMLTQNHTKMIPEFLGQTTAFNRKTIKEHVVIMGDVDNTNRVKYIYGIRGKGAFVFLGGHDPEDFAHYVGEAPTELKYHKHSPGYRLILNNVLFPAAKKKKLKT